MARRSDWKSVRLIIVSTLVAATAVGVLQAGNADEHAALLERRRQSPYYREGLSRAEVGDKWGYRNIEYEIIIPAQFDEVAFFSEGLSAVRKGDKWGYIDRRGEVVIDFQYRDAGKFSEGLADVELFDDHTVAYIDRLGHIVFKQDFEVSAGRVFSEGLAAIEIEWIPAWGYIDRHDELALEMKYTKAGPFSEGVAVIVHGERDGGFGFIDHSGEYAIRPQFDGAFSFREGMAHVRKSTNVIDFIDHTGKSLLGGIPENDYGRLTERSNSIGYLYRFWPRENVLRLIDVPKDE